MTLLVAAMMTLLIAGLVWTLSFLKPRGVTDDRRNR